MPGLSEPGPKGSLDKTSAGGNHVSARGQGLGHRRREPRARREGEGGPAPRPRPGLRPRPGPRPAGARGQRGPASRQLQGERGPGGGAVGAAPPRLRAPAPPRPSPPPPPLPPHLPPCVPARMPNRLAPAFEFVESKKQKERKRAGLVSIRKQLSQKVLSGRRPPSAPPEKCFQAAGQAERAPGEPGIRSPGTGLGCNRGYSELGHDTLSGGPPSLAGFYLCGPLFNGLISI